MRIRRKGINGNLYYYLEESIRLEQPRVYSLFIGSKVPGKKEVGVLEENLLDRIYADVLGGRRQIYLGKRELIEAEKKRIARQKKFGKLSKAQRGEKDGIDCVDFVYTTLSTEGVPVTKSDALLAYGFFEKNVRSVRDENIRVSLDMIRGLRLVKESKKGVSLAFISKLHEAIMGSYPQKNPGALRKKQAFIYLKSFEKVEEISFRPSTPQNIEKELEELVSWYNENVESLNAIELAALFHLRFYKIHPFEDGNKRVSRLLLNKALFDCGYPLLNVSKNAEKYFDSLIRCVEKNAEKPFAQFVLNEFIEKKQ
ncbi:Fic family protein [Candidatus Micrarchaeota archaeon]|nr:Fic family protein [Candidatus Micrarchaeota archaeon]